MAQISTVHVPTMVINEDKQSPICIANGHASKRSKHIDIKYHYVQDKSAQGDVVLEYCKTQEMLADVLTKALPIDQFVELRSLMGMRTSVKI